MATHLLTPNGANPYSGLTNPVLGWEFSGTTVLDVFEGCNTIYKAGWQSKITQDPASTTYPPLWVVEISRAGYAPITVHDTDWFTFDGTNVGVLSLATVQADYTISAYTPPR